MLVLGIETSCDETAAAVVKDGREILSHVVSSSLKFHQKYGGVVPEIASRKQLEAITQVADTSIKEAGVNLKKIGLVSVTKGPGLLGSLVVGISFAKAITLSLGIPLLGIDHLYGHIYAGLLQPQKRKIKNNTAEPQNILPCVGLVVSGGHTSLFYLEDFDKIKLLGATLDDAGGEAFDKVAKILGLGYPGGPLIERMAQKGNPKKIKFCCSGTDRPLDFSFSGIKTAVLYQVTPSTALGAGKSPPRLRSGQASHPLDCARGRQVTSKADIAASFQETVIDTLIKKSLLACRIKKTKHLVIGGGVAVNRRLRERFAEAAKREGLKIYFPESQLCLDNAAMVAGLGYQLFKKGYRSSLNLNVELS